MVPPLGKTRVKPATVCMFLIHTYNLLSLKFYKILVKRVFQYPETVIDDILTMLLSDIKEID